MTEPSISIVRDRILCNPSEAPWQSPLLSFALGPTRTTRSSSGPNWRGILLERHLYSHGERRSASIDTNILSLSHRSSTRFQYRNLVGEFVAASLPSNTIMLTPAGSIPDVRLRTPAELTPCALEADFLRNIASETDCSGEPPEFQPALQHKSIVRIINPLVDELEAGHPFGRLYVDSLAHALATRYLLSDVDAREQSKKSCMPGLMPRIVNRVHDKIESDLDPDLSLEHLAEESGYSRAHILRMFRTATGSTPHQYGLDLRLKRAQERLRRPSASIIDVALACEFSSQSHMTNVFRRCLEVTPGEFRRES